MILRAEQEISLVGNAIQQFACAALPWSTARWATGLTTRSLRVLLSPQMLLSPFTEAVIERIDIERIDLRMPLQCVDGSGLLNVGAFCALSS